MNTELFEELNKFKNLLKETQELKMSCAEHHKYEDAAFCRDMEVKLIKKIDNIIKEMIFEED